MRVVQVVADGRPGGGTVMVLALVEELLRRGHEACLVTDAGSRAAVVGGNLGARVETLPFFRLTGVSRRLAGVLDELKPDTVHAHGSRAGFHVARWLGDRREQRAHYTVHGYHFHHRLWPRRWLGRWAERRTGPAFSSVVHVCEHDREIAERWRLTAAGATGRVIYNGVAIDRLPSAEPDKPPRVAFVGRLVAQKDPRLIAAITSRLAAVSVPVSIVGGGPLAGEVRRLLRDEIAAGGVAMSGEVDHAGALAELARASVLVQCSRWEGLPVVLLEALAMGVPMVAAAVGGVPEIIEHDRTGVLIPDRSPQAFAEAAAQLLAEADTRRRYTAAGQALVARRFSLASFLDRTLALYTV